MSTTTETTPHKTKHRTGAGARFNADHIGIYRAVNAGVLIAALAAILISWSGLSYVGQWVLLPPAFTWLVPVMIDVPIVVFTLATLARRSRGESVWLIAFAAYLLTAVSALANFLHVAAERPLNTIEGAVGASIAALAPMLVLLTTEALGTLITKPPTADSPRSKQKRQAERIKQLEKDQRRLEKEIKLAGVRATEAEERARGAEAKLTPEPAAPVDFEQIREMLRQEGEEWTPPPAPVLPHSVQAHFAGRDPIEQASYLEPSARAWVASTPAR